MSATRLPLLALLLASSTVVWSQSATTAALAGVVHLPTGKPAAGVRLRIRSTALIGGELVSLTAENGAYRFASLPPGHYTIVVEADGYDTMTLQDDLDLGRTATLNLTLTTQAGSEVEVISVNPLLESAPGGVTANFQVEQLDRLPLTRQLDAVLNLTPGINANNAWGGMDRNNAYLLDGVNVTDPSGNAQWILPNMDWFEDVHVGGVGAPAEFGNFTGGYVNAIIKRGGNTVKGGFNGYYGSNAWQSKLHSDDPRLTEEARRIPPGKDWEAGFHLGGPLAKDRLWYFVSASRTHSEATPAGVSQAVVSRNVRFLTKLTWQPTEQGTLEGFFQYDTMDAERRGLNRYVLPVASNRQESPSRSYNLTYTHRVGSDKVVTLKALGFSGHYDMTTYNGQSPCLDVPSLYNGIELFNNAPSEQFNNSRRASLSATFDWFVTSGPSVHALRMGLEQEGSRVDNNWRRTGGVTFYATDTAQWGLQPYMALVGGDSAVKADLRRTTVFVQDTWTLNERLTLTPGLRWERYTGEDGQGVSHWSSNTVAPRLGATIILTSDQAHVLKAHAGRYFEGLSVDWFDRAIRGAYTPEAYYAWGDGTAIDPSSPSTWPAFDPTSAQPSMVSTPYSRMGNSLRHPHADAFTVSYETRLSKHWTAALTWIGKWFRDAVVRTDEAADPGAFRTLLHPLTGQPVQYWSTGLRGNEHQYVIGNDDRAKRNYQSATLSASRELANNWSLNASYTRAVLKGNINRIEGLDDTFLNYNTVTNSEGHLWGCHDHEVKVHGLYALPTRTQVSAIFTYLSGEHWTPFLNAWAGPDNAYLVQFWAAPRGSETLPGRKILDLRISQEVPLGKKARLEVFAEVRNVLNDGAATDWDARLNDGYNGELNPNYKLQLGNEAPRNLRLGMRLQF